MAYSTVSDVEAYLQNWSAIGDLTSSTKPTDTQVTEFITRFEAEINGVLTAQGYTTVPATATDDVDILQSYTTPRAAFEAWGVAYGHNKIPEFVRSWRSDYDAFRERLVRSEQKLPSEGSGTSVSFFKLKLIDDD